MKNLRRLAKGKECQVRIPNICNHNRETTVLAHIRMKGLTGVGMKANDLLGAWCCSSCHDAIDLRVKSRYTKEQLELMHAQGVFRTITEIIKMGELE